MSVEELCKPRLEDEDEKYHGRRWWILAVLGVAQLMVILDGTIVNIALPTAQHALHFSYFSVDAFLTTSVEKMHSSPDSRVSHSPQPSEPRRSTLRCS
jgi:hypothetical protein